MISVMPSMIDQSVHHQQNHHDLYDSTHNARDRSHSGAGLQHAHCSHIGHFWTAGKGQGEGVGRSTQDAQDEALGDVAVLKNGKGDGIHEDDHNTGNDAAHAQQGANDHDDAQCDDILRCVAGVFSDELVHDGGGDGVGGAALSKEGGLDAAEHEHKEETVNGGKDAFGIGFRHSGHEIAARKQNNNA